MSDSQKLRTITFKDFLSLFLGKLWLIILIPLLCMGGVFLQQQFLFTPEYESTATLYILKQENESTYNYTRILEVTVTTHSAALSKEIADQVCRIGTEKIAGAMGFEQVNLYENGLLSSEPSNQLSIITYLLIGILAAIITYSIVIIVYIFDDTLKTQEDIERYLGLSILGDIPNANDKKNHHYGYYSAYGAEDKKRAAKKRRTKA